MDTINSNGNAGSDHEPKILKVTPFQGETGAVASVTLGYGPIAIRARLQRSSKGIFLSMPSRKGSDDKWWDHAYFRDRGLHTRFEQLALEQYRALQTSAA